MYPTYEPNSLVHTIIALVFYVIMAGTVLYTLIALYALLKYGHNKLLAIGVSIFYLIIWASLFAAAVVNLNQV